MLLFARDPDNLLQTGRLLRGNESAR